LIGLSIKHTSVLPRAERDEQSPSPAPRREEREGLPNVVRRGIRGSPEYLAVKII